MALVVSMLFVFSVLFVFGRFPHKRGEGGLIKVKKQVDFNIHFRWFKAFLDHFFSLKVLAWWIIPLFFFKPPLIKDKEYTHGLKWRKKKGYIEILFNMIELDKEGYIIETHSGLYHFPDYN